MSDYISNEKNNTFKWLSSLYNRFKQLIKFFLIQKSKSSTNLNCKEGNQQEATTD